MRSQIYFAVVLLMTLLVAGSDAGAHGNCPQEPDFAQIGTTCPVNVDEKICAVLRKENSWQIDMNLPVCLGRSETLPQYPQEVHTKGCNRYITDARNHSACKNRVMMLCALEGKFGKGVIWKTDDPEKIRLSSKQRPFSYAEVVFMKNQLCHLPQKGVTYPIGSSQPGHQGAR